MEHLEGKNLADALDLLARHKKDVSPGWMFEVLDPIVSTLETAHDRGIVHRDIKAENVFLLDPSRGGGVRLLDFGFSRLERSPSITGNDMIAGSPAYVAPEVWREGSRTANRSVDVYALGVLVFRMLGGKLPFPGSTVEIMRGTTTAPRPSLHALRPDLPKVVDDWVQQVMAIKPDERFSRCIAAWRALRAVLPPSSHP
jgi:serine/threonine-protein kinase